MTRVAVLALLAVLLRFGGAVAQESSVRERAFEEIDPGIFVRGGAAVVVDVEPERCTPQCGAGQVCGQVCEETACREGTSPLARCNDCAWRCE
jgi:hypothetical protein